MSFKASLAVGTQGEKIVHKTLKELGFDTKESNTKEIDIYFASEGKEFSCEVKYDLYSARSGNLAIETFNTKSCKPSGLMSTKADFWFHVLPDNSVYFARVFTVKEFVSTVKPKREVNGGDDNSRMSLYAKDVICGQCLLELTKENLLEEIKKLT